MEQWPKGGSLTITKPGTYWAMNYSEFDTLKQEIVVRMQSEEPSRPNLTLCGNEQLLFSVDNFYHKAQIIWFNGSTKKTEFFLLQVFILLR